MIIKSRNGSALIGSQDQIGSRFMDTILRNYLKMLLKSRKLMINNQVMTLSRSELLCLMNYLPE
jgi:hypothetical protein